MNILMRLREPGLRISRPDPRREATHAIVALMETMWLAPWFVALLAGAKGLSPYSVLTFTAVNMLVALFVVRLLDAWGMWENLRQVVFLSGLAISVLLAMGLVFPPVEQDPILTEISSNIEPIARITIPAFVPIFALVSIVWWRGLRLALTPPTALRVAFGMRMGIISFVAAAFIPDTQAVVLAAMPPFFFFGLLGTSLARALSLREKGGKAVSFSSRWMLFMLAAAFAVTSIGFGASSLISGLGPEGIRGIVQPIVSGVLMVFAALMMPIFWVLSIAIQAVVDWLTNGEGNFEMQPQDFGEVLEAGDQQQLSGPIEEVVRTLQYWFEQLGGVAMCASVAVVLIVVIVIVLTLRRQRRAVMGDDEEREDIEGDGFGGLLDMFRRGFGAIGNALNTVSQFGVGRDLFAALTIRRVYAQMVRIATKQGYPRIPSQTPYEYRAMLHDVYPHVVGEIEIITEAYVRVHYGEVPESGDALREVTDALERLKKPVPKDEQRPKHDGIANLTE